MFIQIKLIFLSQVPVMFALMSGKRKRDYRKVVQAVLDLLPKHPAVQRVVIDFEAAMWRAIHQVNNCFFLRHHIPVGYISNTVISTVMM